MNIELFPMKIMKLNLLPNCPFEGERTFLELMACYCLKNAKAFPNEEMRKREKHMRSYGQ